VVDRNRITGAGVTAGLDFGLSLTARLRDDVYAQGVQLLAEYHPEPPFNAGTPQGAGERITHMMGSMFDPFSASVRAIAAKKQW
jgi:cyclohexyl-isocyanide hydratase